MKKFINTIFIFLLFLTLSGCGFFGDGTMQIADITTQEKDGQLYLVVKYTDEFLEDDYFPLKPGKDGSQGNGIFDIDANGEIKPGYTIVTVKYTNTAQSDESFEIPHGVSIQNIEVVPKTDKDGNPLVDENGELTGEEELLITFTSGKESIRIPYAKPKDGKDGREIELRVTETQIEWKYSGEEEDKWTNLIELEKLKGANGSNITKVEAGTSPLDPSKYLLYVYLDGAEEPSYEVEFNAPTEPAQWHTGNNYPPSNLGKIGDFYLDKTNAKIYQKKGENEWGDPIVDFGSPNGEFDVYFIADNGTIKGTIKGSDHIRVAYGNCVYNDNESIPLVDAPDGYTFVGWFLTSSPKLEIDGKFTDLTPVYKELKLYAYFEPISE